MRSVLTKGCRFERVRFKCVTFSSMNECKELDVIIKEGSNVFKSPV